MESYIYKQTVYECTYKVCVYCDKWFCLLLYYDYEAPGLK